MRLPLGPLIRRVALAPRRGAGLKGCCYAPPRRRPCSWPYSRQRSYHRSSLHDDEPSAGSGTLRDPLASLPDLPDLPDVESLPSSPAALLVPRHRTFIPSPEQQAIVDLCRTQNVMVSARPGAGKTATAEAIVAANPNCPIAVVTYSKRLQLETTHRLEGYQSCDVFTFHGMAGKLFNTVAYTDSVLLELRAEHRAPTWVGRPYEIVIFDELQDCTEQLYWLACTFISSITRAGGGRAPRIVALGDERQAIFDFMGADARFLSMAPDTLSSASPYPWARLTLSKSFRLSHETSRFVNNVFLGGEQYIVGSHQGTKPVYLHTALHHYKTLAEKLVPMIDYYGPGNTAILSPSVRKKTLLALLTNHLSDSGYGVSVVSSEDQPLDELVMHGKICVSTYHQFKGIERDLVIVYGVDNGYFRYMGRNLPDDRCPNAIFVALTRARKQLVVIHDKANQPMPFVDTGLIGRAAFYLDMTGEGMLEPSPPGRPPELGLLLPRTAAVTDLARHVPVDRLEEIVRGRLCVEEVTAPLPEDRHLAAPERTATDPVRSYYEAVSDLNGLAVVAAYEHTLFKTVSTLSSEGRMVPPRSKNRDKWAAWFCRKACEYESQVSGYTSRMVQMRGHDFDWLGPYLEDAVERLQQEFLDPGQLQFEFELEDKRFTVEDVGDGKKAAAAAAATRRAAAPPPIPELKSTRIVGRADMVQYKWRKPTKKPTPITKAVLQRRIDEIDVCVWEIKFVARLNLDHAVQACVYAYLWANEHFPTGNVIPRVILFNVRDGEKKEITAPQGLGGLREIVEGLLRAKHTSRGEKTTEAFLDMCRKARDEVERLEGT